MPTTSRCSAPPCGKRQIADRLDVQERTVKAHLTAIFERLGVRNRTQAGVILRELELTDPSRQLES